MAERICSDEELREALKAVISKPSNNFSNKVRTICTLLRPAGIKINDIAIESEHPVVYLAKEAILDKHSGQEGVFYNFLRFIDDDLKPTSPEFCAVLNILLDTNNDPIKLNRFHNSIFILNGLLKTYKVSLEKNLAEKLAQARIIIKINWLIKKEKAQIYELIKFLGKIPQEYIQWVYDEFMKREDKETFKNNFEANLLTLGAQPQA